MASRRPVDGRAVTNFRVTARDRYNMVLALLAGKHGVSKSTAIDMIFRRSRIIAEKLEEMGYAEAQQ